MPMAPVRANDNSDLGQSDDHSTVETVSPTSKELVIGLVGYAGAGCSKVRDKLEAYLDDAGFTVHTIQLSAEIVKMTDPSKVPAVLDGLHKGKSKLERAVALQNAGDSLRKAHKNYAVAALAVKEIRTLRAKASAGKEKLAFILDSIKHPEEVELLRNVYDKSFRLVAMHCDRSERKKRLCGKRETNAKYGGAPECDVLEYMKRDESDNDNKHGQQVRDAFFLADYFIDNNSPSPDGLRLNDGLKRFVNLLIGKELIRPRKAETGMYHAHAASLRSACLSRQVGASLLSPKGQLIATGTNDAPRFGGGLYEEDYKDDARCFKWKYPIKVDDSTKSEVVQAGGGERVPVFCGCHNDRKKKELRQEMAAWLAQTFSKELAKAAYPIEEGKLDTFVAERERASDAIERTISGSPDKLMDLPKIKDIIEYSRAIHAEMSAVLSAAREGISTVGSTLYCTTFPCHNCARHLVAAGVSEVYYIEPYVKSLAAELHSDAIQTEAPEGAPQAGTGTSVSPTRMMVLPFTGVGPRMYEDCFLKRGVLKERGTGIFLPPAGETPQQAVRLRDLVDVETAAANLVPENKNAK